MGGVGGEFLCLAIVENKGRAGGVAGNPCQGGGAFRVEFSFAKIFCCAGFVDFATAGDATGCPRGRGADQERERDQVPVGMGALTSSLVASSSSAMVQKIVGVNAVNIPGVEIDEGHVFRKQGDGGRWSKAQRGMTRLSGRVPFVALAIVDATRLLGTSVGPYSKSLSKSKALLTGPPYQWVTSTRYPTGVGL